MQLSDHLEVMHHEISGNNTALDREGYRVDGNNGIKVAVGLQIRKSVDYYCIMAKECSFIEFTDLARGQEDLLGINTTIDEIDNSFHRNKLRKLVRQDEWRGLIEKFKDSKDIFAQIPRFYNDIPTPFLDSSAKVFYIVHAPISDELDDSEKAEIARFLLTLKAFVSQQLEDNICKRVKLTLVAKFRQEFS